MNAQNEFLGTAAEHLGTDLMGLVLQEIKALPDVWQKIPEYQQADVIDRIRKRVEGAVSNAVHTIFAQGGVRVVADLEQVAIKDEIKATFRVSRANPIDALQSLYDAHKEPCLLIVANTDEFTGGMDQVQPDPDQPGFDLSSADDAIDGEIAEDTDNSLAAPGDDPEDDPLYQEAVELVVEHQRVSISWLQKQLRIGYNRAARLIERMEADHIVSEPDGHGGRVVFRKPKGDAA